MVECASGDTFFLLAHAYGMLISKIGIKGAPEIKSELYIEYFTVHFASIDLDDGLLHVQYRAMHWANNENYIVWCR